MDHEKWDHSTYLMFLIKYNQAKDLNRGSFEFTGTTFLVCNAEILIGMMSKKNNINMRG